MIALFALSIAGCATQQLPIANDLAAKIKRVSVVSMTAKSFTRHYTGLTVFGNEAEEIDISEWKIDEKYEDQIRNELVRGFAIDAVAAPYPESEFAHVNDLNGPWDAPAFWGPNWDAIATATKNYCSGNSLDAVLVVAKSKSGDFIAGTNQFFGGAGIYSRGPIKKMAALHLISRVALLDCATAKPLAIRTLASRQSGSLGDIMRSSPMQLIDFDESRIPIQQWTPEQKQRIQNQLIVLPRQAIKETLKSILPESGKF